MDNLLRENFNLKKEIAHEKKRYLDLMNAFIELRTSLKLKEEEQARPTENE